MSRVPARTIKRHVPHSGGGGVLFNLGDPRHLNSQAGDVIFKPEDGLLLYYNHAAPSAATVSACEAAQATLYPNAPVNQLHGGELACRLESMGSFHDVSFVQIVDVSKAQSKTQPEITVKVWFRSPL